MGKSHGYHNRTQLMWVYNFTIRKYICTSHLNLTKSQKEIRIFALHSNATLIGNTRPRLPSGSLVSDISKMTISLHICPVMPCLHMDKIPKLPLSHVGKGKKEAPLVYRSCQLVMNMFVMDFSKVLAFNFMLSVKSHKQFDLEHLGHNLISG